MDKTKAINVGLIGCCVVGSGLVELFSENHNNGINLKKVTVKDSKKSRKI